MVTQVNTGITSTNKKILNLANSSHFYNVNLSDFVLRSHCNCRILFKSQRDILSFNPKYIYSVWNATALYHHAVNIGINRCIQVYYRVDMKRCFTHLTQN